MLSVLITKTKQNKQPKGHKEIPEGGAYGYYFDCGDGIPEFACV